MDRGLFMTHQFCFNYVRVINDPPIRILNHYQASAMQNELTGEVIGRIVHHGELDIPYKLFQAITNNNFMCRETAEPMG